MQRKAYVPGVAVLLAAALTACTGSGDDGTTDDPRPGEVTASASTAQPGRYDTLPEACGSIDDDTLEALLPGLKQLPDAEQREEAYEGRATLTYDTDRKAGCRWKVESPTATDYLFVDFERVVSFSGAVSDDSKAQEVYGGKVAAADLPEPSPSTTEGEADGGSSANPSQSAAPSDSATSSTSSASSKSPDSSGSSDPSGSATASSTPASLQPRTLDGLGDEAFLDDALGTSRQRTVTVVFRTSNVIVTVEYEEQPATTTDVPDSEEMQDKARNLAELLAEAFDE
ncbi:DUF3558 domain-containing protein [Streptomyces heilongjiangensis]|uniref:DUF3558 domain-containing protein n=1 Tax=Streptomyces heilongjiangensis TaxID=945052 RepID=A0ABW1BBY5_9ACTN|nr:DUF3558 domain-containing protein [Streptomyces heilongjiangensis]MDC2951471.1 DUF3558 domain-containing protein [Streptomyces heilongjiangensis]